MGIVEHVDWTFNMTSPNLLSVFCICTGHKKTKNKNKLKKAEHKVTESTYL